MIFPAASRTAVETTFSSLRARLECALGDPCSPGGLDELVRRHGASVQMLAHEVPRVGAIGPILRRRRRRDVLGEDVRRPHVGDVPGLEDLVLSDHEGHAGIGHPVVAFPHSGHHSRLVARVWAHDGTHPRDRCPGRRSDCEGDRVAGALGRVNEADDARPGPIGLACQAGECGADDGVVVGVAGDRIPEAIDHDQVQPELGEVLTE